jgi:pimeloyl-ACP methyl ester carboxylesterase
MLTKLNNKELYYRALGPENAPPIVFVHGLGQTNEYFTPLIYELNLHTSHRCHLFDLEGHGLSPTHPLSTLSISSFAADLDALFVHANIPSRARLIADSMGCLVALQFTLSHPDKVSHLLLTSPPPIPLPETTKTELYERAEIARTQGMPAIIDTINETEIHPTTALKNPLGLTAVRMSLLSQDPEGYAKACTALANATGHSDTSNIKVDCHIITGVQEKLPCEQLAQAMHGHGFVQVVQDVGRWQMFESSKGVARAIEGMPSKVLWEEEDVGR